MKRCSSCGEYKPTDEFYKNKSRPDGRNAYCAKCVKNQDKERRSKPEKKKKVKEVSRQWYLSNRESELQKTSEWRAKNPGRVFEHNADRRARKSGSVGKISSKEWQELCNKYGNKCLRCGMTDVKLTLDHIIPLSDRGENTIRNAQPLCLKCNRIKGKKHTDYRTSDMQS